MTNDAPYIPSDIAEALGRQLLGTPVGGNTNESVREQILKARQAISRQQLVTRIKLLTGCHVSTSREIRNCLRNAMDELEKLEMS